MFLVNLDAKHSATSVLRVRAHPVRGGSTRILKLTVPEVSSMVVLYGMGIAASSSDNYAIQAWI